MKHFIREFLIMLLIGAVIFIGLRSTVQTVIIHLPSMEPNFWEGQWLLVSKVVYSLHDPERGDVIIFRPPLSQHNSYIKRIIGLPGERVEIKEGIVYVHLEDGDILILDEPYIKEPANNDFKGDIIPENQYFVMGDNRNNSNDSRNGWTASHDSIIGKAWISIWPPNLWRLAANYPLKEQVASAANE